MRFCFDIRAEILEIDWFESFERSSDMILQKTCETRQNPEDFPRFLKNAEK